MRGLGSIRGSRALGAVIVAVVVVAGACSGADAESQAALDQLEAEVGSLVDQLGAQSEEIASLHALTSDQSREITALRTLTSELDREIGSVRESVDAPAIAAANQDVIQRLAAVETGIAEHGVLLGWQGNYADGLWGDMQAVLDCLDEIIETGGVPLIPNNSCRLIAAGMMGG